MVRPVRQAQDKQSSPQAQRSLVLNCNKLVGKKVLLRGRVNALRDHGKILFIDLLDESGIVQTVSRKKLDVFYQDIVEIEGIVRKRPESLINKDLETGTIEVQIEDFKIISRAKTLPIPIENDGYDLDENLRLKYRYLDLRRPRMQKNIRLRSKISQLTREYLEKEGFVEIETPYLSAATPEGSRDFLVPSRLHSGNFYALPQSPQQYKQLLMIAGFEKYYQLARAFRDEDLRADRQFEHTQIDIEMSYVEKEDIMSVVEGLFKYVAKTLGRKIQNDPFPVFTYKEAMEKFGQDKFDLKKDKNDDVLAFAWVIDFPLLEYIPEEKRYTFSHNPFCSPKTECIEDLMNGKNLDKLVSNQYDIVLNGEEVGGGSIRITDPKVQRQVFRLMGYSDSKIDRDFGHLLSAYDYGAPKHGGIALGLDRFCAIMAGEKSIREVIAFPASGSGQTSVMNAPSPIDEKTLKELGLKVS